MDTRRPSGRLHRDGSTIMYDQDDESTYDESNGPRDPRGIRGWLA